MMSTEMDVKQLRENILNFSLDDGPQGNQGYTRVLLQLFGNTGHGKSSFINSCKYVFDQTESYTQFAEAGDTEDGGAMTTMRKSYELTTNITLVDNRGYKKMDSFERAEMYAQLGNFIPIGEKVEWINNYTDMMNRIEDAEEDARFSDFIVPILVYRATCLLWSQDQHDRCTENENRKEMKTFMDNCVKMTGLYPIIVITYKTSGDFAALQKQFIGMGADTANIIAIENYTQNDYIKTPGRTRDILKIIHMALNNVRFRMTEVKNARIGWRNRKKFLLNYIHKAELQKKEKEWRREEEKRKGEAKR